MSTATDSAEVLKKFKGVLLDFTFKGVIKDENGVKTYRGIANTPALDRDGEVLMPKGCIIDDFMKNPVMLEIHDYGKVPVAKVLNIDITKDYVFFDFQWDTDDISKDLERKYNEGFMSAFSVGFMPEKWVGLDTDNPPKSVDIEYPDGTKDTIDLSNYEKTPYRIYTAWKLLEISPVPVPSNPEALILRSIEHIKYKAFTVAGVKGDFVKGEMEKLFAGIAGGLTLLAKQCEDGECHICGAVESHSVPTVEDGTKWNVGDAKASIAIFASEDGSGEKDTINWARYAEGFAHFDESQVDKFSSYLMLHHMIVGGNLMLHASGLYKSMETLLTDKDAVGEDLNSVYAHLVRHYEDMELIAPDSSKTYTEDELKAIGDGSYKAEVEGNIEDDNTIVNLNIDAEGIKTLIDTLAGIKESVDTLDSDIRVRLGMIEENLKEIHDKVAATEGLIQADPKHELPEGFEKALDGFVKIGSDN